MNCGAEKIVMHSPGHGQDLFLENYSCLILSYELSVDHSEDSSNQLPLIFFSAPTLDEQEKII